MADMFKTSLSGLIGSQRALATTSHNIANANTDGYSRQRTDLVTRPAERFGFGYIGRGVEVNSVERITDRFVDLRYQNALTENARLSSFHGLASRLDELMASDRGGLAPTLQSFFNAIQDVSNNPSSAPARQVMLSEAQSLTDRFHYLDDRVEDIASDVNRQIEGIVLDINIYSESLAALNRKIVAATGAANGRPPNDLLDQRDILIRKLSELVDVETVTQLDGAVNVFIGNGQALVVGGVGQQLVSAPDSTNPADIDIGFQRGSTIVRVGDRLRGGQLGGLFDFGREMLDQTRNELGRIAIVLTETFNQQHVKGMDLSGALGGNFFGNRTGDVISHVANSGTATVTTTFTDVSQLTSSDYRLSYDGTNYSLERLSDGTTVSGAGPTLAMDGMSLAIGAGAVSGDSYLVRPTHSGARDFSVVVKELNKIAVGAPVRVEASINNLRDAPVGPITVLDETDTDLTDRIELRFHESPATFDVFDVASSTVLSAGVAFTPGDDYDLNGWRVRIDGAPAEGDVYTIEPNISGVSDNRNALLLGALRETSLVEGNASFQQAYGSLVGRIGAQTRHAEFSAQAQERFTLDAENARNAISGVNLDEEAINLTRYQRTYQAAAQVVNVSNTLFDELMSAVRR